MQPSLEMYWAQVIVMVLTKPFVPKILISIVKQNYRVSFLKKQKFKLSFVELNTVVWVLVYTLCRDLDWDISGGLLPIS